MTELAKLSQEEAKEKIKAGEKIENVYIERISLSKFELTQPVEITGCKIDTIDFNKSQFKKDFILRQCEVGTLVLAEAIFHGKCNLKKTKVGRGKLQRIQFKGAVNAESSCLIHTSFYESVFEQTVNFGYASFIGDATFQGTEFRKNSKWNSVKIDGAGTYIGTWWGEKADFRQVNVSNDLNFSGSTFESDLLLIGAVIGLNLNLDNCTFHAKTDLSNIMSGRNISILNVNLADTQSFRFANTTTPGLNIEGTTMEGHIYPENAGEYARAAKEYAFLRTTFQKMNRFDEEDWAYYQFKRMQRKGTPLGLNPLNWIKRILEYLFLDIGCGYGTKPFRTLGVVAALVFTFGVCYSALGSVGNADFGISNPKLHNFLNAMNTSLIAFSGGYGDLQISGISRLLAMMEYMIGVIFMGLFVVSFSRKIIR